MLRIVWLSDTHFNATGTVLGHDPRARLDAAIAHINTHYADYDLCLLSGDVVEDPTPENYQDIARRLRLLSLPVFPMTGNHDDRTLLREALPLPDSTMPEFVQYALETCAGRILCLDTLDVGQSSGWLCADRLGWLDTQLSIAPQDDLFLFLHHPPAPLGLPMQDSELLRNGDVLLERLAAHGRVRYLFAGHVHRSLSGTMRGIPFSTLPAVLYQAPPIKPDWTWDSFTPAQDAPRMGLITIENGDVRLNFSQICDYAVGAP